MTLEKATGQESIIKDIEAHLFKGQIISVSINGFSGSGKSWLLHSLSNIISDKGGCAIQLQGDQGRINEIYYPLTVFIEQKNKISKKSVKASKKLIAEIPVVGAAIESFLEDIDLQSFSKGDKDFEAYGLNKQKQFATHFVSLLDKHSILAVICDDMQDFDSPTFAYLDNLIKYLNSRTFDTSIVFVFGVNAERENSVGKNNWLSAHHYEYTIKRIERSQLNNILILMGLKNELNEAELDLIYSSTGGHLHVLHTVIDYLNKNHENNLLLGQGKNLIYNLLESRLQQFQQYYSLIKELLLALGGVGKAGTKAELLCLLENSEDSLEAMKYAEELDFISIKDGYLLFTHEIVKEYVTSLEHKRKPSFYRKFSDCLRALNPSNYLRRAWAEEMSGNKEKADVYRSLFIIQRMRLGLYDEAAELFNLFTSEEAESLRAIMEIFLVCYRNNADGILNEALISLSTLPFELSQELLAEKIYLECEILLKHTDYPSRQEAIQKLESWDVLKEEEPEQWYRFSQLKLLAYSELGNFEFATKMEQEIAIYFTKRANYDISAKDILNRLNLFSEIVYSPEIAHIKLTQTYNNLKREIEAENYDKLLDYYISLCNLSGNCISTNRISLSLDYGKKAMTLIKEYPQVYFPHKEATLNNLLLASHFMQAETSETILKTFNQLSKNILDEDGILITTNHAGILVRQNQLKEAEMLLKANGYLIDVDQTDAFYLYYHKFNYGLVLYLLGKKDEALVVLEPLKRFERQINNKLTSFYMRHYELTLEIINQHEIMDYKQLCRLFEDKQPRYLNLSWEKFKPVYLFTDLQIWTNN